MAKYMILGVGNRMRGDDGAGSILAERFANSVNDEEWASVDGNVLPENYTSIIKRESPEKLYIVDICNLDKEAGSYYYVPLEALIESYKFNTHSAPLKIFVDYLKEHVKEIIMIGIQPKNINMFDELSPEVDNSINDIIDILRKKDFDKIPYLH